jgi:putative tryptophan/tyrosine transport system substrate-binding protein
VLIATPGSTAATFAAKAVTASVPIVFGIGSDPEKIGLISRLNRPGGNLTGATNLTVELAPKQLEVLHELLPTATTLSLLVNPTNATLAEAQSADVLAAARVLGLIVQVVEARNDRDLDGVFRSLRRSAAAGLLVSADALFTSRRDQIVALASQYAFPTIYGQREFVLSGGLISYSSNLAELYRLTGIYSGRILKGELPAQLPIQRSTKIELAINLRTAKALGIQVPPTLLARADEVIE